MDFDDLLTAVPRHSNHASTVWADIDERIQHSCKLVDTVTVSSLPLVEEFRRYHDDVRYIPNAIDASVWPPSAPSRPRNGKLRVSWTGGVGHAGDLQQMIEVLRVLADEVEWVFLGMTIDTIRPHLTEFHKGVGFGDYPAKLGNLGLDLAIAPLQVNRFNECKSNLRLLEYGALATPAIASDIIPCRCQLPVTLLANRPKDWIRAIRERVGEHDALRREGTALREAVLRDWARERILPQWRDTWVG